MQVVFSRSPKIGSRLIRAVTWSEYSHVALVDGERVIEATWPRVRVTSLDAFIAEHPARVFAELPTDCPGAVLAWARSQVGKPYDVTALFGLLAHRDWQASDRWFCSELVAWAFDMAGTPLFRRAALHRVTPQDLWAISTGGV